VPRTSPPAEQDRVREVHRAPADAPPKRERCQAQDDALRRTERADADGERDRDVHREHDPGHQERDPPQGIAQLPPRVRTHSLPYALGKGDDGGHSTT